MVLRRRRYNREYKLAVIQEIQAGLSVAEASRRYELHPNMIRGWQKEYRLHGDRAFAGTGKKVYGTTTQEGQEVKIAVLERKIGQLLMENEFLKKLIALHRKARRSGGNTEQ